MTGFIRRLLRIRPGLDVRAALVVAGAFLAGTLMPHPLLESGPSSPWSSYAPPTGGAAASIPDNRSTTQVIRDSRNYTVRILSRGGESWSTGSGVLYDSRGFIVTNAHVVEGADTVTVYLADGTSLEGRVLGRISEPDLALVQVPGGPFPQATFADSATAEAGDPVIVLGYPSAVGLTGQASASRGIVSRSAREVGAHYIQVDASVNPGVSGGPLLDSRGQLLGIISGRLENDSGRLVEGIGLAIPSNIIRDALPKLQRQAHTQRP